jgi:lipopolysaccharide/colanic/teichoic acid biosynthesis glycosyltransferase
MLILVQRFWPADHTLSLPSYAAVTMLWIVAASGVGLYRDVSRVSLRRQLWGLAATALVPALTATGLAALASDWTRAAWIPAAAAVTLVVAVTLRYFAHRAVCRLLRSGRLAEKIVVIGPPDLAEEFLDSLDHRWGPHYEVLAALPPMPVDSAAARGPETELYEAILRDADTLFLLRRADEEDIAGTPPVFARSAPRAMVVPPEVIPLLELPHLREIPGLPLYAEGAQHRMGTVAAALKRGFDLLAVIALAFVLLPAALATAALVLLASPGPVLFRQARALCRGGREFLIYKFRTMIPDADGQKERLRHRNESDGALFKVKDDPRVVPGSKFLRRFSLDELPQFLNVLRREMSLVGPRPLPVGDLETCAEQDGLTSWEPLRCEAAPGITGLWQVSGRSELSYAQMLLLDLYYARHQSLGLDTEIAFSTLPAVLSARGSS